MIWDANEQISEELEHQFFLSRMRKLQNEIFWKLRNPSVDTVLKEYYDIQTYGDEPIFAALLFERALKEAENTE